MAGKKAEFHIEDVMESLTLDDKDLDAVIAASEDLFNSLNYEKLRIKPLLPEAITINNTLTDWINHVKAEHEAIAKIKLEHQNVPCHFHIIIKKYNETFARLKSKYTQQNTTQQIEKMMSDLISNNLELSAKLQSFIDGEKNKESKKHGLVRKLKALARKFAEVTEYAEEVKRRHAEVRKNIELLEEQLKKIAEIARQ